MIWLRLPIKSIAARRLAAGLIVIAIACSFGLLIAVEKVRVAARNSFLSTISGTDLIVGPRGGSVELLLQTVFFSSQQQTMLSWNTIERLRASPEVAWAEPISLGDAHRGFPVVGTERGFFEHFAYRDGQKLSLARGSIYANLYDAVLGADVAARLGYTVGATITIGHGAGQTSFFAHDDNPFKVVGILKPTGTPVDQAILVSLQAIEALHIDWRGGAAPAAGARISATEALARKLDPQRATAVMVGLRSKFHALSLMRAINESAQEPLTAIMPGVVMQEIMSLTRPFESALRLVSISVVGVALAGMAAAILAGLEARRREMAILRAIGASPLHIAGLLLTESLFLSTAGAITGFAVVHAALWSASTQVDRLFGLSLGTVIPSVGDLIWIGLAVLSGALVGLIPAIRAYRLSVSDGLAAP